LGLGLGFEVEVEAEVETGVEALLEVEAQWSPEIGDRFEHAAACPGSPD